jgi:hypothetical protein
MAIDLAGIQLPEGATVDIRIHITAQVNITAFVARQKVNRYVIEEISTQLRADEPALRVADRLCWLVPVVFTLPGKGVVGQVGELLVDAVTGELLVDQETRVKMTDDVERLAQRAAS